MWPFLEAARKLELPVEAALELFGWTSARPPGDARLDHGLANDLLLWAVRQTGRADLGLLAALEVEPGHFDLVELATRSQGSVGEAIETLAGLVTVLHGGLQVTLHQAQDGCRLDIRLHDTCPVHPCAYDFIAGTLVIAARRQTGRDQLYLRAIHLPYPEPADTAHLRNFFHTPLDFKADALSFHFDPAALALPLLRSDAHVGQLLTEAARQLLPASVRSPLELRVRELVAEGLASGQADLAAVAQCMHLSERTLRRNLKEAGVGFRELVDGLRREMAMEKLKQPQLSTEQVASDLGFSSAQAFHRAFRRWTGQTVQAWRAAQRSIGRA